MPFTFDGNTPEAISYYGNNVKTLICNGDVVWQEPEQTATLYSTSSRWAESGNEWHNNETEIWLRAAGGYGRLTFDGHSKLRNFTKATFHFYITANPSTVHCYARSGATNDPDKYNTGLEDVYHIYQYFSSKGWHKFDLTEQLQALLANSPNLPTLGIKLLFKSGNNVRISTHTGAYPPYIVLE